MNAIRRIGAPLAALAVAGMMAAAAQQPPRPPAAPPVVAAPVNPALWPKLESPLKADAAMERFVADLLAKLTIEEKVGQVIQPDIGSVTPEDMRRYHFGSILNGGNSAPDKNEFAPASRWLQLADAFWEASVDRSNGGQGIPSIWGTDAVHGHSNIVGATLFPHNIGLGAMRNPELIEAIGRATAAEVRATGMEWTFAPTLTVPRDTRWGRSYEGYSEDPAVVTSYAAAMAAPPTAATRATRASTKQPCNACAARSPGSSRSAWALPATSSATGMGMGRSRAAVRPTVPPRSWPASTCTWRRTAGAASTTACWRRRRAASCRWRAARPSRRSSEPAGGAPDC